MRSTHLLPLALGTALAAPLVSCSSGTSVGETSSLTFTITDAASDELSSFEVELSSLTVAKAGGTPVSILSEPLRIDLTNLVDLSQIVDVREVPAGLYTSASITFDFSEASAYLIGETSPATILDSDGLALDGEVTLPLSLGFLMVMPGKNRVLECDFDLDQSVMVDAGANAITVEPVLNFDIDPAEPKELVVLGALQSVDQLTSMIALERQTLGGNPLGDLDISVEASTTYQIDGVPYLGAAGLAELASRPVDTWVQAYGTIDPALAMFHAEYLEAGTGTYNGGSDIVEGHITGRSGGAGTDTILTVVGHSNNADHTAFQFNTTFTVSTDFLDTKVLRRGASVAGDTDDLNIGQRVRIFGTLTGASLDASTSTSVVRMQRTRFLGFANEAPSAGTVEIDLVRVGLRPQAVFNWGEGGTSPLDPDALVADVSMLLGGVDAADLEIGIGTAVSMRGFLPPVDDDDEDFEARLLINRDKGPSLLSIHDRVGPLTVVPTITSTEIQLAISGTPGLFEHAVIDRGFVGLVALPDTPTPTIVPQGLLGLYSIRHKGTMGTSLYLNFAAFAAALELELGQGSTIFNLGAIGPYDAPTNTTSAKIVSVVVH